MAVPSQGGVALFVVLLQGCLLFLCVLRAVSSGCLGSTPEYWLGSVFTNTSGLQVHKYPPPVRT